MQGTPIDQQRIKAAWQGRVSGCLLGKPVEVLSLREGRDGLDACLRDGDALPFRNDVPINADVVERTIAVAESIGTRH